MRLGLNEDEAQKYWVERTARQGELVVGYGGHTTLMEQDKEYEEKRGFVLPFLNKTAKTIDYGCGIGRWSDVFVGDYLGVDITPQAISIAQERNKVSLAYGQYEILSEPFFTDENSYITTFLEDVEQFFSSTCLQHCSDGLVKRIFASLKKYAKKDLTFVLYEASTIGGMAHCKGRSFTDYTNFLSEHWKIRAASSEEHLVHGQPHSVHRIEVINVQS